MLLILSLTVYAGCNSNDSNSSDSQAASSGTDSGTHSQRGTQSEQNDEATSSAPPVTPVVNIPTLDITFDDIKFPHKADEPYDSALLTKKVLSLVGRHVRIRGYILPTFQGEGLTHFVLVRDDQECCFGPGAALFDCIRIVMDEGKTASFTPGPVAVEGRFDIEEMRDYEDVTRAVFKMNGKEVK